MSRRCPEHTNSLDIFPSAILPIVARIRKGNIIFFLIQALFNGSAQFRCMPFNFPVLSSDTPTEVHWSLTGKSVPRHL